MGLPRALRPGRAYVLDRRQSLSVNTLASVLVLASGHRTPDSNPSYTKLSIDLQQSSVIVNRADYNRRRRAVRRSIAVEVRSRGVRRKQTPAVRRAERACVKTSCQPETRQRIGIVPKMESIPIGCSRVSGSDKTRGVNQCIRHKKNVSEKKLFVMKSRSRK